MVESSGLLKVILRTPVPVLYEEDTSVGRIPSVTSTVAVVWAIPLPAISATAPADMVMVLTTAVRWAASRVAVMVPSEWLLGETSFSVTLPFSPDSTIPE